ncbi:uncharacterized protein [Ptychodera flava]|uniref:uncharacterized protein isoform X2 n=1 Tax=Ptychodera flava TaxID=63121 RepID=UPI00396A1944
MRKRLTYKYVYYKVNKRHSYEMKFTIMVALSLVVALSRTEGKPTQYQKTEQEKPTSTWTYFGELKERLYAKTTAEYLIKEDVEESSGVDVSEKIKSSNEDEGTGQRKKSEKLQQIAPRRDTGPHGDMEPCGFQMDACGEIKRLTETEPRGEMEPRAEIVAAREIEELTDKREQKKSFSVDGCTTETCEAEKTSENREVAILFTKEFHELEGKIKEEKSA